MGGAALSARACKVQPSTLAAVAFFCCTEYDCCLRSEAWPIRKDPLDADVVRAVPA